MLWSRRRDDYRRAVAHLWRPLHCGRSWRRRGLLLCLLLMLRLRQRWRQSGAVVRGSPKLALLLRLLPLLLLLLLLLPLHRVRILTFLLLHR